MTAQSVSVFKTPTSGKDAKDLLIEQLYKTIGELTMDVDLLKKAVSVSMKKRKDYIKVLIISRQ